MYFGTGALGPGRAAQHPGHAGSRRPLACLVWSSAAAPARAATSHTKTLPTPSQAAGFKRAVEDATELQDRRAGREPATQHEPLDFRAMPQGWRAEDDLLSSGDELAVRLPAGGAAPADAEAASAEDALALLQDMARGVHTTQVGSCRRRPCHMQGGHPCRRGGALVLWR